MKYRIFYNSHYRGDILDFSKDILAKADEDAVKQANKLIDKLNKDRMLKTREEIRSRNAELANRLSYSELLAGNFYELTGVSRVKSKKVPAVITKEKLTPVPLSVPSPSL